MHTLSYINFIITVVFFVFSCHKIVFVAVKFFKRERKYAALKMNRFAVVISARNEEAVIGHLIDSIHNQDYPADLVDVFVVADNCTDATAEIARQKGAFVYERFNKEQVGKGYALNMVFNKIKTEHANTKYDGYFIFDADNLLDSRYITEMNKVFSNGIKAVTSCRNTKNYTDSWVSAGYGLWFMMVSEYRNYPKSELGVSCSISGTGFLFSDELLERSGGWSYHLMSEDMEFTADLVTAGEKVGYCRNAVLYDEQPKTFSESITQRSRWMKGSMMVLGKYGGKLVKDIFKNGNFSSYSMLMEEVPTIVVSGVGIIVNLLMFFVALKGTPTDFQMYMEGLVSIMINSYLVAYVIGITVLITEWKKINGSAFKKILYTLGFPLFILSFGLAVLTALFNNVEWKPIKHTAAISISEVKSKKD